MKRSALVAILLFFVCGSALAQGYRGRDFWVCFPQNAIIERDDMALSLSIYITSENRATGTITNLFDSSIQHFSIESGSSIERDIDTEIEIDSSEQWQHNVLHITSDQDISLYVVTHRRASTDSYMAIPTELLGKEYVVAGYAALKNGMESFTSQATLVGTDDNTWVTVHLTGPTRGGLPKGRTLMFGLHRGETFQIQGARYGGDLTGSTVTANKPIAFFTGHSCAQVPQGVTFCNTLLEMEPPANDWGRSFILTTFEGKDYFVARVIAKEDSTIVTVNGVKSKTINHGEFYEVDTFYHNAVITTSKPALVAQYCTSTDADSVKVGDPFMLIVVPSDRFIREVTTSSVTHGIWKDYLNIVVPDSAITTLQIDGAFVGLGRFITGVELKHKSQIPGEKSTVFTFQVGSGRHLVECAAPMAVYGYGFGVDNFNYDSYGHACGMRLGP